jgi:hypothetical protein
LSNVLKQQVISGVVSISEKHAVSLFRAFLQIVFSTYDTKRCHDLEYHYKKCRQIKLYNSDDRTCKVAITLSDLWSHDWNKTRWVSLKNEENHNYVGSVMSVARRCQE